MAVKEEEIPEGFKKLREKFPSGIQYWPSNFPRLEDGEWFGIGQYTELTDDIRDFLKENAKLFGQYDTVLRLGILYNFQIWDYPHYNKPDETLEDRGVSLFYTMSTKRIFCLSLFSDWLDVLGMPQQKEIIDQAKLMEDYKDLAFKDEQYALLIKYLMDVDHRNCLGTPLKRFLEARFFILDLLKPGVISDPEFLLMKEEYMPKLKPNECIDLTNILELIIFFDHYDDFRFSQLRKALLRGGKDVLLPRLDQFVTENEFKLRNLNLY